MGRRVRKGGSEGVRGGREGGRKEGREGLTLALTAQHV